VDVALGSMDIHPVPSLEQRGESLDDFPASVASSTDDENSRESFPHESRGIACTDKFEGCSIC
jgi:hypothetical protein